MTNRMKYLLIAACVSAMMWAGIINGIMWSLSDGTDHTFTASPR